MPSQNGAVGQLFEHIGTFLPVLMAGEGFHFDDRVAVNVSGAGNLLDDLKDLIAFLVN